MPRPKDPASRTGKVTVTTVREMPGDEQLVSEKTYSGGVYKSQLKAIEKWEKNNPKEKIILRVPEGTRKQITEYVEHKAQEDPQNPLYSSYNGRYFRPSVNAFITALIEKETGIKMS